MSKIDHCAECGAVLPGAEGSIRSLQQLRRYMKLMHVCWMNWPEAHERQFTNAMELRAYLQMKAGHREVAATIPISGMNKERAMLLAEAAIRAAGSYAMPVLHGDTLVIFKPKSIAFSRLGHKEFCKLNDEVDAVILAETGMEAETLLREASRAA